MSSGIALRGDGDRVLTVGDLFCRVGPRGHRRTVYLFERVARLNRTEHRLTADGPNGADHRRRNDNAAVVQGQGDRDGPSHREILPLARGLLRAGGPEAFRRLR